MGSHFYWFCPVNMRWNQLVSCIFNCCCTFLDALTLHYPRCMFLVVYRILKNCYWLFPMLELLILPSYSSELLLIWYYRHNGNQRVCTRYLYLICRGIILLNLYKSHFWCNIYYWICRIICFVIGLFGQWERVLLSFTL